jgi:hypothetical protein
MPPNKNPGFFQIPEGDVGGGANPIVPQSVSFTSRGPAGNGVLLPGAAVDMVFQVHSLPLFDAFLFADQIITVNILIAADQTFPFRLLDGVPWAVGVANTLKQVIRGLRLAGEVVDIQFQNNSGVATTVFEANVHCRSI